MGEAPLQNYPSGSFGAPPSVFAHPLRKVKAQDLMRQGQLGKKDDDVRKGGVHNHGLSGHRQLPRDDREIGHGCRTCDHGCLGEKIGPGHGHRAIEQKWHKKGVHGRKTGRDPVELAVLGWMDAEMQQQAAEGYEKIDPNQLTNLFPEHEKASFFYNSRIIASAI